MKIPERIPDKKYIFQIYGLIVMFIYGWSFYRFIWILPSWIKYLTFNEIGILLAYTLVTNLFESTLILIGLIAISIVLPMKWFHNDFVARGGLNVLYLLLLITLVAYNAAPVNQLGNYITRAVIDLAFLNFVIGYVPPLQRFIVSLADRSTIFLYLSIPSSILALIVVFFRNI